MKAVLNTLSFSIAAGYVVAEVTALAGVRLPAFVNAQNAVVALTAMLVIAMVAADYARKTRLPAFTARAMPAQAVARVGGVRVRPQAYSIRRGAEAARLANPPVVSLTRKSVRAVVRAA